MTSTDTRRYGTATVQAWNRPHPRLTSRCAWANHAGPLPIIEGTVLLLRVGHLPSGRVNKPVWLWCSGVNATSVGTPHRTGQVDPGTRPARVPQHPHEDRTSDNDTKTHPTGPGRPLGSRNRVVAQGFDAGLVLATEQAHTRPANHKKGAKPR